jgi:hypothetical protein
MKELKRKLREEMVRERNMEIEAVLNKLSDDTQNS